MSEAVDPVPSVPPAARAGPEAWIVHAPSLSANWQARCAAVLSPEEADRAAAYRQPRDRQNCRIGHGLARILSAERAGCRPEDLRWASTETGKPFWGDGCGIAFNLSHSGPYVALVLGPGTEALGIDLQRDDRSIDCRGIADFAFSEAERAHLADVTRDAGEAAARARFFTLWVLREAGAKATGHGVFDITRKISALPVPPAGAWSAAPGFHAPLRMWPLAPQDLPEGYVGAVAMTQGQAGDQAPPALQVHRALPARAEPAARAVHERPGQPRTGG